MQLNDQTKICVMSRAIKFIFRFLKEGEDPCVCETNPSKSSELDVELSGLHYPITKMSQACNDLMELARTTRVKLPKLIEFYCEMSNETINLW